MFRNKGRGGGSGEALLRESQHPERSFGPSRHFCPHRAKTEWTFTERYPFTRGETWTPRTAKRYRRSDMRALGTGTSDRHRWFQQGRNYSTNTVGSDETAVHFMMYYAAGRVLSFSGCRVAHSRVPNGATGVPFKLSTPHLYRHIAS